MNQQEKQKLQKDLLEITGFREVLSQYYVATDALSWRHWLDLPIDSDGVAWCSVGSHTLNISALRKTLLNLDGSGLPLPAVHHLYRLICNSIRETAFTSLFQLMEPASENKDAAPPSIKQLTAYLQTPESKEIIEKLCGNSKNNLSSLEERIDRLWEEHGKSAYVFRNPLIHGRITLSDPKSQAWKELIGNEQSSKDFYNTLEGIYDILNFVSKSFFGERRDLPTYEEFAESVFEDKMGASVWCFDTIKFPAKFDASDFPVNVLPPE